MSCPRGCPLPRGPRAAAVAMCPQRDPRRRCRPLRPRGLEPSRTSDQRSEAGAGRAALHTPPSSPAASAAGQWDSGQWKACLEAAQAGLPAQARRGPGPVRWPGRPLRCEPPWRVTLRFLRPSALDLSRAPSGVVHEAVTAWCGCGALSAVVFTPEPKGQGFHAVAGQGTAGRFPLAAVPAVPPQTTRSRRGAHFPPCGRLPGQAHRAHAERPKRDGHHAAPHAWQSALKQRRLTVSHNLNYKSNGSPGMRTRAPRAAQGALAHSSGA
jgi:hypothetical protein